VTPKDDHIGIARFNNGFSIVTFKTTSSQYGAIENLP
jgi:hypothetical protein